VNTIKHWLDNPRIRGRLIALAWSLLLFASMSSRAFADSGGLGEALANLTKMLIDGLIALAALLLAIGFATNFVSGMAETIAGRPMGLSNTWVRIGGILIAFVGAIFTIQIANTIIDTLSQYKSNDPIHLP
jgi:type IV secretory pathway VirB2 component (pilin)